MKSQNKPQQPRFKGPTSFRLSPTALDILRWLSEEDGISHTAILETLIRERARQRGYRGYKAPVTTA